jgi:hypothetical protein
MQRSNSASREQGILELRRTYSFRINPYTPIKTSQPTCLSRGGASFEQRGRRKDAPPLCRQPTSERPAPPSAMQSALTLTRRRMTDDNGNDRDSSKSCCADGRLRTVYVRPRRRLHRRRRHPNLKRRSGQRGHHCEVCAGRRRRLPLTRREVGRLEEGGERECSGDGAAISSVQPAKQCSNWPRSEASAPVAPELTAAAATRAADALRALTIATS